MTGWVRMDVVALSASTVLGSWGFDILRRVLLECKSTLEIVERDDPFSPEEDERGGAHRLWLSRSPNAELFGRLEATSSPIVAFLDHPLDSVRHVKAAQECDTLEAIRVVTASAAVIRTLQRTKPILVVDRDFAGGDARLVVASIAEYLLSFYPGEGLEQFLARDDLGSDDLIPMELELKNLVPGYMPLEEVRKEFTPEDVELVSAILGDLSIWPGRAVSTRWPRSVFLIGDEKDFPQRSVTDVTGVARVLYYGPYLHLPASRFKVRVTLGFSAETTSNTFTLQGWDGELLGSARVKPNSAGLFVAAFDLSVERPYLPIEIRVSNDQGAIEGKMALVEVELVEWSIDAERERPRALAS